MPTFFYSAMDNAGKNASGTLTADSRSNALDELVSRGLIPVSVKSDSPDAPSRRDTIDLADAQAPRTLNFSFASRSVSAVQVEAFTRELANLLAAGVPLSRALMILCRENSSPAAKAQWQAIHDDVVGGKPLAEALARRGDLFPPVYIAMIRAGEMGGFLDVVLNQIADFRARETELVGRVKSAMVYPCVLATVAIGVLIFLLTFFIPRFTGIFEDFGASLPLLTQIIILASKAVTQYGPVVGVAVLAIYLLIRRALLTEEGRRFAERTSLQIPGVGVILARFALVRFARMLGTLLAAGVPLVNSLRVAQEAIGNQTLSDAVALAIEEVKRGSSLSQSLRSCRQLFPPSVIEMIAVAEESSRLDKELLRLAQTYESELDRRLRMLVALAEPALLLVMASIIGAIVIGMLLPIFTLQEMIK